MTGVQTCALPIFSFIFASTENAYPVLFFLAAAALLLALTTDWVAANLWLVQRARGRRSNEL